MFAAAFEAVSALLMVTAAEQAAREEARRLEACIARMADDPAGAYEDGLAWLAEGGRPFARHCAALALIELGEPGEGAARLEALAAAPDAGAMAARVIYLAQAGNAWLLAHNPEAALNAFSSAVRFSPFDGALRKDRARAYIALGRWDEAGADLDRAIEAAPRDVEALRLRALALLERGRLEEAFADIETARAAAPADLDVLVLRGRIREAQRLAPAR